MNDKKAEGITSFANLLALGQMENIAAGGHGEDPVNFGHKFEMPGETDAEGSYKIPSTDMMKHRYDPVVTQVTNLLMKDGKKSAAQRVGSSVSLSFPPALQCGADAFLGTPILTISFCRTCHSF